MSHDKINTTLREQAQAPEIYGAAVKYPELVNHLKSRLGSDVTVNPTHFELPAGGVPFGHAILSIMNGFITNKPEVEGVATTLVETKVVDAAEPGATISFVSGILSPEQLVARSRMLTDRVNEVLEAVESPRRLPSL